MRNTLKVNVQVCRDYQMIKAIVKKGRQNGQEKSTGQAFFLLFRSGDEQLSVVNETRSIAQNPKV